MGSAEDARQVPPSDASEYRIPPPLPRRSNAKPGLPRRSPTEAGPRSRLPRRSSERRQVLDPYRAVPTRSQPAAPKPTKAGGSVAHFCSRIAQKNNSKIFLTWTAFVQPPLLDLAQKIQ